MKCITFWLASLLYAAPVFCQQPVKEIDALLKTSYKDNEPGAFVTITVNHTLVFKKGYGVASTQTNEKITSSTNFNIGSITKQFTAFCIVQLAAKKQLSLQDKLIQYFPDFNPVTGNAITIRQLLTHSSGIIDHYNFTDTGIIKHATDKDVLQAVKKIDSTYFAPGTQYRYSNTAYCLLAMIIEKVSGMPYHLYLKKNIFTPLSMHHSEVLQIGKPIYRQAIGYDHQNNSAPFSRLDANEAIFFSTEGDGGIYTSADDYLRWLKFLHQSSSANKETVRQCLSAQYPVDAANKLSYGYGWFISEKDSAKAVYHTGSNGGFRAIVFTIPSQRYTISIFSNRTGVDLEKLVQQINDILGVTNNSFTKLEALVSFMDSSPNFAPCKEIP